MEQAGKAKRTSVPPVIVFIVGIGHLDGIVEILETDSVREDVQNLLTLPIGPDREALTLEEVRHKFELQNSSLVQNFNLQVRHY